jgi:hypothetical protein
MNLPSGRLLRSRVVEQVSTALAGALDRDLTGYAVLAPQQTLLLDGGGRGVLTFEAGVPVVAYHTGTERGGPPALADVDPGPYQLDLYDLPQGDLQPVHDLQPLRVPPGMPAERLAGDPDLADRTRERAPPERLETDASPTDPVEQFLADEERIAAIRDRAREEAAARAEEWGFDEALE